MNGMTLNDAMVFGHSSEVSIRCPDKNHIDKSASASYNPYNGMWYCHACGAYGKASKKTMTAKEARVVLFVRDCPKVSYDEAWIEPVIAVQDYWKLRFPHAEKWLTRYEFGTSVDTGEPCFIVVVARA